MIRATIDLPARSAPGRVERHVLTIVNDGTCSDGSSDAPTGAYDVRLFGPDGRVVERRVTGWDRRRSWRELVAVALVGCEEDGSDG